MQHISEILAEWEARLRTCQDLRATVDGEALCRLALNDLRRVNEAKGDESLSLQEAAKDCGYHPDSLSRLMHAGRLENVGTEHRPRFRRIDLPRRPGPQRSALPSTLVALGGGNRSPSAAAIVREAVGSRSRSSRG